MDGQGAVMFLGAHISNDNNTIDRNHTQEIKWLDKITSPPPLLEFRAWFNESSTTRSTIIRREVKVEYDARECQFTISIQGCDHIYKVNQILDRTNRQHALNHLDLHVGAVIDILGKSTTLKQANLVTSQWIENEAKHLERLITSISSEMRKYGLKALGDSVVASPIVLRKSINPAAHNLRDLLNKIESFYMQLEKVRPQIALEWAKANRNTSVGHHLSRAHYSKSRSGAQSTDLVALDRKPSLFN